VVLVARAFAVRGVVEGFYGTPWTHAARLDVCSFLAPRGMNAYVYAPKDDAKHRAQWRAPYETDEIERFRALAAHAGGLDVRFGFAISPGLDITYESDDDRATLYEKLAPMRDAGVGWFLLLVDDIPMQRGLAPRQAALVSWMRDTLDPAAITVCPTEYVGTHPSQYLAELSAGLPADVDVMWTGPTVCSPEITADDARGWVKAVTRSTRARRVVVWDNYPVNDALMTNCLHLGPYRGRDPDLVDVVAGVLCNPMIQAHASQVALATAMDFMRDPDDYDADASWAAAIDAVGGARAGSLGVLARACADSPVARPETLDLARRVDALDDEIDGPGWPAAIDDVAQELRATRALADDFPVDGDPLAREISPWAGAARTEADAGLAALALLQHVRPVAALQGTRGVGAAPRAEAAMQHAFIVLFAWSAARADEKVVFGPRFVVYTPVIQLADGSPGLDAAAAVREDANAVDRLCRLALAAYDEWRAAADAPLRVLVDGEERPVGSDGTFDAHGDMVLLRHGPYCTRVRPGARMPFPDARLSRA
jgi:hyaluronoglucosaminidase